MKKRIFGQGNTEEGKNICLWFLEIVETNNLFHKGLVVTLKQWFIGISFSVLAATGAQAGTVSGKITTATNASVANGTITFTLSQAAVIAGTSTLATSPVNCWTDSAGNVAGLPGSAAVAAPSLTTGTGSLPGGTYFVRYTWANGSGESEPSTERSVALGGSGAVVLVAPLNVPAAATSMKVYIGASSGTETLQGSVAVTSGVLAGNFTQSTALVSGAALPAGNSSSCSLRFNDEMVPSFTSYKVNLQTASGVVVPGYPQKWYLSGASVNVSVGTPLSSGVVQYPQAIVANPSANATQSISGPLNLNGFGLTAGSVSTSGPFLVPDGTAGAPGLAFSLEPTTGWGRSSGGQAFLSISGLRKILWDVTQRMSSTFALTWSSAVEPFGNPPDTSLSRLQPNVVAVGSGSSGAVDGFLNGQGIALNRASNTGASFGYDNTGKFQFGAAAVVGWTSGLSSAGIDAGISRTAAGTIAIGNGNQGDTSGVLKVATILGTALGGTGASNPDTKYNRLKANQGSAISCADVNSITNFGSGATCAAASGSDSAGSITISSAGTGQVANGSFILTFHDGTWTNTPTCVANRSEGFAPGNALMTTFSSATNVQFFFIGLPVAGNVYSANFICIGH